MEFELNKTQKDIQKAVRDFVKEEFDKELAYELDKKHEFPRIIWKKACDLGLIGVQMGICMMATAEVILEDVRVPVKKSYR